MISWPTAAVLIAVLVTLGALAYLDHSQAAVIVALVGAAATAAMPQLVKKQ